jgi:hypothetical protein
MTTTKSRDAVLKATFFVVAGEEERRRTLRCEMSVKGI